MSDLVIREKTPEEIKHYLIAISKDITESNKLLLELIEEDENISLCICCFLHLLFKLDRTTNKVFMETEKQFKKELSEMHKTD